MLPDEHKTKQFSNKAKVLGCKQDFQLDYCRAAAQTVVGETMKRDFNICLESWIRQRLWNPQAVSETFTAPSLWASEAHQEGFVK